MSLHRFAIPVPIPDIAIRPKTIGLILTPVLPEREIIIPDIAKEPTNSGKTIIVAKYNLCLIFSAFHINSLGRTNIYSVHLHYIMRHVLYQCEHGRFILPLIDNRHHKLSSEAFVIVSAPVSNAIFSSIPVLKASAIFSPTDRY